MMLKNAQLVSRGIPYLYDTTRKTFLTFFVILVIFNLCSHHRIIHLKKLFSAKQYQRVLPSHCLSKNLERTNKASWQRTNPMQFLLRMFWFKMKNDRILQISTKWSSGPASSFGCAQIQILAESTH